VSTPDQDGEQVMTYDSKIFMRCINFDLFNLKGRVCFEEERRGGGKKHRIYEPQQHAGIASLSIGNKLLLFLKRSQMSSNILTYVYGF
jgi:hypothetical protein